MKNLDSMGLKFRDGKLTILDQQKLPHEEIWLESHTPDDMIGFIKALKVRGAPLIGVAAALALANWARAEFGSKAFLRDDNESSSNQRTKFLLAAQNLRESRPTAVNLMAAIDRLLDTAEKSDFSTDKILSKAIEIFDEDVKLCEEMASEGAKYVEDGNNILTHCNSGGLATVGRGTALGVITKAAETKKIHVWVDETRPLLQGARLTAWELGKLKIPHTLICDNMAATLMAQGKVDKIFVGADRIARNGDFANKIGTYSLAVLAKHHGIPFYVVAPKTTVDLNCSSGTQIPVEEREASEVRGMSGPKESLVFNPAFDVTPSSLVSAYVPRNLPIN